MGQSLAEVVAGLSDAEREAVLEDLDPTELQFDAKFWLRPEQIPPPAFSGVGDAAIWAVIAGRGFGKGLVHGTPVRVADSRRFVAVEELEPGDLVVDADGDPAPVTAVYHRGLQPLWRVTLHTGELFTTDGDHLWTVLRGKAVHRWWGIPEAERPSWWSGPGAITVTTPELRYGDVIMAATSLALTPDDKDVALPVDPYAFGAWLGDGDTGGSGIGISAADREIIDRVAATVSDAVIWESGDPRYKSPFLCFKSRELGAALRSLGLSSRRAKVPKFIPDEYKEASTAQRLALLQGAMDTDGSVNKAGNWCGVGFVNERLRDDIYEVIVSLGYVARRRTLMKGVHGRPETIKPFYTVDFRPDPSKQPFYLARKAERVTPIPHSQGTRKLAHRVQSVEQLAGLAETTCITVDTPSHLFLAGHALVPTHNTRTGGEWVRDVARENPGCRVALVARTSADVRDVMVQGESGIIACTPPSEQPTYEPSKRRVTWPNGCQATLFSSEEPSQLRGPQFHFSWGDEVASWDFKPDDSGLNAWDNLVIATRLGDRPRVLATTTPKRTPFMRSLVDFEKRGIAVLTRGSTYDNASNLSPAYLEVITGLYAGTRLGAQELEGIVLDDVEGALWMEDMIDLDRVEVMPVNAPLKFVGVDPSVAEKPKDECGIVVVYASNERKLHQRHAWVVEDASIHGSPNAWAQRVVDTARRHGAPVIAESNQGGELVRMALQQVDPSVPVFLVHSKDGKALRAEPVSGAYEQHRVHHVGYLPMLEAQQTSWVPGETRDSPDRLDALVHAVTAAMIRPPKGYYAPGQGRVRAKASRGRTQRPATGLTSSSMNEKIARARGAFSGRR